MTTKQVVYRDSKDGRFTTRNKAERSPSTTERQHVTIRRSSSASKKK